MLGRFDCTELFGTVSGRHELLGSGRANGVKVYGGSTHTDDNCIDFGSIGQDEIFLRSEPAPLGYSDQLAEQSMEWVVEKSLYMSSENNLENVTLCEAQFLPNMKTGPTFSIFTENYEPIEGTTLRCGVDSHFRLRINVGTKNYSSYIGKWLLLCFQGDVQRTKRTSITTVQFLMAVKLTGCVAGPIGINGKSLSSESKPFIPRSILAYFDDPVNVYGTTVNPLLPQSFVTSQSIKDFMPVPDEINQNYHSALSSRCLEQFVELFPYLLELSPLPMTLEAAREYLMRLSLLACLEESHMQISIKSYDMPFTSIHFSLSNEYKKLECTLKVKGSQENRPKVLIGDTVRLRSLRQTGADISNKNSAMFEMQGVVKSFRLGTEEAVVEFPFPDTYAFQRPYAKLPEKAIYDENRYILEKVNALKYHVRFTFDRSGFGFIQESIQTILDPFNVSILQMLFPSDKIIAPLERFLSKQYISAVSSQDTTSLNSQQLSVVGHLVDQAKAMVNMTEISIPNVPFVIFGPPGTGKTVTVVESIRQIIRTSPATRILACAPSDAAADVLCQRIGAFLPLSCLFRLNWWQRIVESVPPDVQPYCRMSTDGMFVLPSMSELSGFQAIVATCGSAGALRHADSNIGFNEYLSFDFVFIDEACQALEAEALVPVSYCKPTGQLVLAGDQFQLGPQPRSPVFSMTNSLQSLQERILRYSRYSHLLPSINTASNAVPVRDRFVPGVMLANNYRSHKDIFEVSSRLFYGGLLVQSAKTLQINALLGLRDDFVTANNLSGSGLFTPSSGSPILFLGCRGTQKHELDSPSYFNDLEITRVLSVCTFLLRWEGRGVSLRDIGIIAAYRSQVLKLRLALRNIGLGGINVGSVEDFQGREVRIVIISTVISDQTHLLHEPGLLGLLGDARRFNVAVTRGIAATIVVGHPDVLRMDISFRAFIDFCQDRNSCAGELWETKMIEDEDDLSEANSLLNSAAVIALGYGRNVGSGSTFGDIDPMEAYYRDDIEWRTML